MSKFDYVGMPPSPKREAKLRKRHNQLAEMSRLICQKFGNVLPENDVRALSGVLIKHPNARTGLLEEQNFRGVISLLKADNLDRAAFAVEKLATHRQLVASI